MPRWDKTLFERIDEKTIPEPMSGCWLWTGVTDRSGYGQVRQGKLNTPAHRLNYERFVGPIPDGLLLRHVCDLPCCVNPQHLVPGTHKDNSDDKFARGRFRLNPKQISRDAGRRPSVLSVSDVMQIRGMGLNTKRDWVLIRSLANQYGVTTRTMQRAINGISWKRL
jgi:hypothetical protein